MHFLDKLNKKDPNRREIFVMSRNALITLAALNLGIQLPGCMTIEKGTFSDWKDPLETSFVGGVAFAHKIEGQAFVDGIPIQLNIPIASGKKIQVAPKSLLFLTLPDGSVLKATGKAELVLNLDPQSGGILQLNHGSLLNVIHKRNKFRMKPYLFRGANSVVGIKGTVFFAHVFGEEGISDKRIPVNTSEYFCLCNGQADFISPEEQLVMETDSADHHNSYYVSLEGKRPRFQEANRLLFHSDAEIIRLVKTMKGEKHDTSWINRAADDGYSY